MATQEPLRGRRFERPLVWTESHEIQAVYTDEATFMLYGSDTLH